MIFADKLIRLRKKMGLSQEELAFKMNVSRQAVSKWESAQSIPDLEKVLQLSKIFDVSTDYLLKDELEIEEELENDTEVRIVKLEEANEYLKHTNKVALKLSIGTILCILSPILLIVLSFLSDESIGLVSPKLAVIIGLSVLFLFVVTAVILFVTTGFSNDKYSYIIQNEFTLEYGVNSILKEKKNNFKRRYNIFILIGVILCILSPVALVITSFTENLAAVTLSLALLFLMVSISVFMFVLVGVKWQTFYKLLNTDKTKIKKLQKESKISTIIWLTATIIYLSVSFAFGYWQLTWIVWVIAALIQVIILTISKE